MMRVYPHSPHLVGPHSLTWVASLMLVAGTGCVTNTTGGLGGPGLVDGGATDGFAPAFDGNFGFADGSTRACGGAAGGAGTRPALPGKMTLSTPVFEGIVSAAEPPPAIAGGTLLVTRNGTRVIVGDADRDRAYIVQLGGAPEFEVTVRASVALSPHDQPGRLVEDGAGRIHLLLRGSGQLATIDPAAGKLTARRAVCSSPRGLAYDAAADRLLVACADGQLVTFTPTGDAPERTVQLPADLRDVVVDGPRVMVTRFRSAETIVLDAAGKQLELIKPVAFRNEMVQGNTPFSPAVAWRTVSMPGGGAMMIHQRGMDGPVHETPGGYGGFSPCDSIVHTSVTRVKSGERPSPGPALPGFVLPVDVAVSADGNQVAMIAAGNGHALLARKLFVTGVDDVTQEWIGGCSQDDKHGPSPAPTCGRTIVASGVCPPGLLPCGDGCIDKETKCFVDGGASDVTKINADAGGTDDPPETNGTSASCYMDVPPGSEPVAVGFVGNDRVVVQTREPAQLWVMSKNGNAQNVPLTQESRSDTGHAVFHSNSGGGLACASCHPEGHEDGRVWQFDCDMRRRTQDLSGGLGGTEPFHWSGDLKDFPTLMDTVFVGRMSGPALGRDHMMSALSWINTVPARPPLRSAADAQVQRGKALFENPTVGCATCHAGAALTNNTTVDVGTSAPFQVPSLRGVAWRAPYMHNGCSATLSGRFNNAYCDGGDAHGKTSQLTAAQLADLVAFLESL